VDTPTDPRSPLSAHIAGSLLLHQVKGFYQQLGTDNLGRIEDIYTSDVEFRDPVHTLHGCLALRRYLRKMADNLLMYHMRYIDEVIGFHAAYLTWEMDYAHQQLNGGKVITVRGMSHVKFTDRIYYHEDSYDLGALIYERVPLLGLPIRSLKQRLAR
jgi:hypothetical protein